MFSFVISNTNSVRSLLSLPQNSRVSSLLLRPAMTSPTPMEAPTPPDTNRPANCFLLSAVNYQTPSMQPWFKPIHRHGPSMQEFVAYTADKCFKAVEGLLSGNPLLRRILSLPSEFQVVCHQIRCRNHTIAKANLWSSHNFAAVLPGDSVAGLVVANGLINFLNLYNTVLVVRLVLTWFPSAPPAIVSPLSTLCDPYLNLFRGIIPPLGGLDLSPVLAFLVLNAFTSTASALPAELPENGTAQQHRRSPARFSDLTSSQDKWLRRLGGKTSKGSNSST